jgi:hypothetical protein
LQLSVVVITLVFFVKPPHAMTEDLDLTSVAESVDTTPTYPMNPLMIEDLSADMHSSEEWIPQVPPEPVASLRIRPTTTTTTIPYPEGKCSEWYPHSLSSWMAIGRFT